MEENSGLELESLDKATVAELLADKDGEGLVKEVLRIRYISISVTTSWRQ